MAWLSSEHKIAAILEIAKDAGRVFEPLAATNLVGASKKLIHESKQAGFSVYYGYYGGQWCLVGVGPVNAFGGRPIKKAVWNRTPKPAPAWTPLSDREKPARLSDAAELGSYAIGKRADQTYILGRVTALDSDGRIAVAADTSGKPWAAPDFWMAARDQHTTGALFNEGRVKFDGFNSLVTTTYHKAKKLAKGGAPMVKQVNATAAAHTTPGSAMTASSAASRIAAYNQAIEAGCTKEEARAFAAGQGSDVIVGEARRDFKEAPPVIAPKTRDLAAEYAEAVEAGDEDAAEDVLADVRHAAMQKEEARLLAEFPDIKSTVLDSKLIDHIMAVQDAFIAEAGSPFATE